MNKCVLLWKNIIAAKQVHGLSFRSTVCGASKLDQSNTDDRFSLRNKQLIWSSIFVRLTHNLVEKSFFGNGLRAIFEFVIIVCRWCWTAKKTTSQNFCQVAVTLRRRPRASLPQLNQGNPPREQASVVRDPSKLNQRQVACHWNWWKKWVLKFCDSCGCENERALSPGPELSARSGLRRWTHWAALLYRL